MRKIRVKLEATFLGTEIEYGVTDGLPPVFQILDAFFFRDCHWMTAMNDMFFSTLEERESWNMT